MINSLTITNFRNHSCSRINTNGAGNVIITGPNGSGKTAILEAVSILGGNGGLRGAGLDEILKFGTDSFAVFANLSDDTKISVSWARGDATRRVKIDGDNAPLSDLAARLKIVWLTPKEDRLFVDSVSDRRAFFDRLIVNTDPKHAGHVARLGKLLSERAFALKRGTAAPPIASQMRRVDDGWLTAIEKQIAAMAVSVAAARIKYAGEINYYLANASVSVSGMIENMLLNMPAVDAEKDYIKYLAENRVLAGDKMIIDGAHKSDFSVFNKTLNLPVNLTSTGQQKSVLVDLILAHAKLVKNPIVLLDEAAAHLDENARIRMFAELAASHAQVWATGIDAVIFKSIDDATFIEL